MWFFVQSVYTVDVVYDDDIYRVPCLIKHYSAVAVLGTFPHTTPEDEVI